MKLNIDTSLVELSDFKPASLSATKAKRLAEAVASYSGKTELRSVNVGDLLSYYPMRYEDRSKTISVSDIEHETEAAVELYVRISGGYRVGKNRPRGKPPLFIFEVTAGDLERKKKPVVVWWFVSGKRAVGIIEFLKKKFSNGTRFIAFGEWKWDGRRNTYSLKLQKPDELEVFENEEQQEEGNSDESESNTAPEARRQDAVHVARRVPVYRKLGEFESKRLREINDAVIRATDFSSMEDHLPPEVAEKYKLLSRSDALREIHFPPENSSLLDYAGFRSEAHRRLIFEEFYWLSFVLRYRRGQVQAVAKGPTFQNLKKHRKEAMKIPPFVLTGAQNRVLEDVFDDMESGLSMNRLVQGDVGSGKTIVAFLAAYVAVKCGYQAVIMAPTEILAEQHYKNALQLFEGQKIRTNLLVGSLGAADKKKLQKMIAEGDTDLIIGTHAVIQDAVDFAKLGLAVIDEQHRFGVAQRSRLREEQGNPDVLVMTATPIPRSLAMTVYGDLEVSVIDELPPGRTPVKTVVVGESERKGVYKGIQREIDAGRQVYIVYPLIEESENLDLKAATDMFDELREKVFSGVTIDILHGKMKSQEKERVMSKFKSGETSILVSTTVIEVGVDVPNATLMVIEHAERFGLSQLHQLRGRVGRGAVESFCVLMSNEKKTAVAKERLGIMEDSNDGFVIAEKDLELRGQGEIVGTRQSGIQAFRLANILRDLNILTTARAEVEARFDVSADLTEFAELASKVQTDSRLGYFGVG